MLQVAVAHFSETDPDHLMSHSEITFELCCCHQYWTAKMCLQKLNNLNNHFEYMFSNLCEDVLVQGETFPRQKILLLSEVQTRPMTGCQFTTMLTYRQPYRQPSTLTPSGSCQNAVTCLFFTFRRQTHRLRSH